MSLLTWLRSLLHIDSVQLSAHFQTLENIMDTVTLTVNDAGSTPACTANAAATNNGVTFSPGFDFTTSDATVATVAGTSDPSKAIVTWIKDPSGPSTRTATITATVQSGFPGAGQSVSGVATVISSNDNVSLTFNFDTAP